jgi:hypothetical protein
MSNNRVTLKHMLAGHVIKKLYHIKNIFGYEAHC